MYHQKLIIPVKVLHQNYIKYYVRYRLKGCYVIMNLDLIVSRKRYLIPHDYSL
jgi:hypothetical protein